MVRFYFLIVLLLFSACGGSSAQNVAPHPDASEDIPSARLALTVRDESHFDPPKSSYNEVDHFVITVSGAGLIAPLVKTYPAETQNAEIDGIAAGAVVDVKVEAFNRDGYIFKRGYSENVAIDESVQNAILNIEHVPIFTNLTSHSLPVAGRLHFKTFSNPAHAISLTAIDAEGRTLLIENSDGATHVRGDADTGIAHWYPKNLPAGTYRLILRDEDNRESSTLDSQIGNAVAALPLQMTSGNTLGSMRYRDEKNNSHLWEFLEVQP